MAEIAIASKGLRIAHFRQLLSYIRHRENEGWYYGPREQFEKRHADLRKFVEDAIALLESGK
jgi:hypothetical protein